MYSKIILAGGSGYIGQVLADYYRSKAKRIIILSRGQHPDREHISYLVWNGSTGGEWEHELEAADLLINLSGKNVNCRYTRKNREEIFSSRLQPTTLLGQVIARLKTPPKVWINIASSTIYRHAEDRPQDEDTGEIGSGFSVDVCKAWEAAFKKAETHLTKKILLRVAIVIGKKDEVIPKMKILARMGLGGHQGNGRQYISWIHEQDLARITEWVSKHGEDGAIYNCAAPQAVQNREFMKWIRTITGRRFGLPTPAWLLETGAAIIRTETELILKSRWVYPSSLLRKGFQFQYPTLSTALKEIVGKNPG